MEDLLHIYVTAYNRERYLSATINSILNQKYRDFKLFVLDNCSTDNTEQKIKGISDDRINYIRHPQNIGGIENIAYAFEHATSKYFVVFHDDDIMKPDCIGKMLSIMEANPDISVLTSLADNIDSEGNLIKTAKNNTGELLTRSGKQMFDSYLNEKWDVVFPTAMYRREFVQKYGIRPNAIAGPSYDVLIFFEIERCGGVCAIVKEALINYRLHSEQYSYTSCVVMLEKLFRYLQSDPYYKALLDNVVDKQSRYYRELMRRAICITSDGRMTLDAFYEAAPKYQEIFTVDRITAIVGSAAIKMMRICPRLIRCAYLGAKAIKRRIKR